MRFLRILCWLIAFVPPITGVCNSWNEAQISKSATLDIYWYTSVPFISLNNQGIIEGAEVEILELFKDFVKKRHGVEITLNWLQATSFLNIIERLESEGKPNILGTSAFSITKERQQILKFTDPYLPDVAVLVSSARTPVFQTLEEVNNLLSEMIAVTIQGTSYEKMLLDLKKQLNIDFDILYISSDENILDNIALGRNRFGFIDLPIHLMSVKEGNDFTRQNFFTVRGQGYGVAMPLNSDWTVPFNQFLADPAYQGEISKVISRYIGPELYDFMESIYQNEQIGTSLLTKEKELQQALIDSTRARLEKERQFRQYLIGGLIVITLFLVAIAFLFLRNRNKTLLLIEQNKQIEKQQGDIRQKNDQLLNRNKQLITLNEDKNNLISILAHDLRSPLTQIIAVSDLLEISIEKINPKDKEMLTQIGNSARRINEMITKILDVESLENNNNQVLHEQVDIGLIMQDIANRYIPIAAQKDITFQMVLCPNNYMIATDHLLLFLILENLVSNAVKFSKSSTTITLEASCNPKEVEFQVTDEGPGLTDEDKKLVFKRFQKLSAVPTGDETSTGLGLSIVKKYVNDLGGKVWVESEEGKGSRFFVTIPKT